MNKEKEILHYDNIYIEGDYGPRDYWTGEGKYYLENSLPIDIEVDKEDIIDILTNLVVEKESDNFSEENFSEEVDQYVIDNYYDLLDKYQELILDRFKEEAEELAWELTLLARGVI